MRERNESGLTIKVFCEKAGFHENIYYYWQRKLREAACEQLTETSTGTAPASLSTGGFVEARLPEPVARPSFPRGASYGAIHIEVAGIQISADSAYPTTNLAELVRGLSLC
jgi:hypothetical protein